LIAQSTFQQFAYQDKHGNYFLTKDRIFGAFIIDNKKIRKSMKLAGQKRSQQLIESEVNHDNRLIETLSVVEKKLIENQLRVKGFENALRKGLNTNPPRRRRRSLHQKKKKPESKGTSGGEDIGSVSASNTTPTQSHFSGVNDSSLLHSFQTPPRSQDIPRDRNSMTYSEYMSARENGLLVSVEGGNATKTGKKFQLFGEQDQESCSENALYSPALSGVGSLTSLSTSKLKQRLDTRLGMEI
jgi:hypothetical protein